MLGRGRPEARQGVPGMRRAPPRPRRPHLDPIGPAPPERIPHASAPAALPPPSDPPEAIMLAGRAWRERAGGGAGPRLPQAVPGGGAAALRGGGGGPEGAPWRPCPAGPQFLSLNVAARTELPRAALLGAHGPVPAGGRCGVLRVLGELRR